MLLAIVKFLFTPSAMIATGYSFIETVLITLSGALIGVVIFYYAGTQIFEAIAKRRRKKRKAFTRLNRAIVKVKNNFGVIGLASTMGLISVPVCTLLAARYFRHNKMTLWFLMISAAIWTLFLSGISVYLKDLFT